MIINVYKREWIIPINARNHHMRVFSRINTSSSPKPLDANPVYVSKQSATDYLSNVQQQRDNCQLVLGHVYGTKDFLLSVNRRSWYELTDIHPQKIIIIKVIDWKTSVGNN